MDSNDLALFAANFGRTCCPKRPKADLDGDGDIDGYDLVIFADAYAIKASQADLNTDGSVNTSDLAVFAADFGRTDCLD